MLVGAEVMNSRLQMFPFDERIKLVEDLWDSIAADQHALALTTEQVGPSAFLRHSHCGIALREVVVR